MEFPFELIKELHFTPRRSPISYDLRPLHKISQLLLVLRLASFQNTASLVKLQIFNWAFKSKDGVEALRSIKNGQTFPTISFDPSLNRALALGAAQQLIEFRVNTGKFAITPRGLQWCESIVKDKQVLSVEKQLIQTIGRISDDTIKTLYRKRYPV